MKQQCIPKFLKEEISKYVCVIMIKKRLKAWYRVTPYMTKIMTMYNNIPEKNIIQSYTASDLRLNGYFPKQSEMFARKWFRTNLEPFCTTDNIKMYMDRYYPEGME